jgi:hypothetical protein
MSETATETVGFVLAPWLVAEPAVMTEEEFRQGVWGDWPNPQVSKEDLVKAFQAINSAYTASYSGLCGPSRHQLTDRSEYDEMRVRCTKARLISDHAHIPLPAGELVWSFDPAIDR